MIYIGLDVHKVNTTVAWLDRETGEISAAHNCPTGQLRELERTRQRLSRCPQRRCSRPSKFLARQPR